MGKCGFLEENAHFMEETVAKLSVAHEKTAVMLRISP